MRHLSAVQKQEALAAEKFGDFPGGVEVDVVKVDAVQADRVEVGVVQIGVVQVGAVEVGLH